MEKQSKISLDISYAKEPGNNGYSGSINGMKGVVAHGDTVEEMKSELLRMLRIKLSIIDGNHNQG